MKKIFLSAALFLTCLTMSAQRSRSNVIVGFPSGSNVLDATYNNNAQNLSEISSYLQWVEKDKSLELKEIILSGSASPEGSVADNGTLAGERLQAIENYIRTIAPSGVSIKKEVNSLDWKQLSAWVSVSNVPEKEKVMSILAEAPSTTTYNNKEVDSRVVKLMNLNGGKSWKYIDQNFLSLMRSAQVAFVVEDKTARPTQPQMQPGACGAQKKECGMPCCKEGQPTGEQPKPCCQEGKPALEPMKSCCGEGKPMSQPAPHAFDNDIDDSDNGIVSLAGRKSFVFKSKKGDFVLKPYLLVQTNGNFNWYDDEGLDKAYNQDNVENSGFSIPYAILGFTGKAFGKVSFNLSINAAKTGGALLQQAWFDVKFKEPVQLRVGKFKTPFSHAYLTTLGETAFPQLPTSLTTAVIMPYSLNAVTPNIATGYDLGVELHGVVKEKFGYELGIFNGTGISVNTATKTLSDDWHIPSLLYAGRLTYMPWGVMPTTQGSPERLHEKKMLIGLSGSMNVESESESTNDARLGAEFALLYKRLYIGGEFYWMNVGFTKRQKINEHYNYLGGYIQGAYFVAPRVQVAARYDIMNRNSTSKDGLLNMPAVGVNYFFKGCNLKLQAMYQYTGRTGHETQLDRDNDNLGLATHSATLQLQYSF